jgi:hypothetical protein
MGVEDEVGGMSLGIPEPGLTRVLDASEINDICKKVFNQSADLYDLRIFDFARAVEALVIRRVKEKREARAHHQASALFPVEEI